MVSWIRGRPLAEEAAGGRQHSDVIAAFRFMNNPMMATQAGIYKAQRSSLVQGAQDVTGLIGNTPLLALHGLFDLPTGVELYAKAEWFNPGGSVKDRAALSIIQDAERRGLLGPGKRLLDATSGNTGIAYAMIGAARGYGVTLCVPGSINAERKRILAAYGAELIFTDPRETTDGAQIKAREMAVADPDLYFYADQYGNPANWRAHYEGTGPEIWRQTGGAVTHFVAMLGTTGTFTGVGRRLRELNPLIALIDVQPDSPLAGIEGTKHLATAIVPAIYQENLANAHSFVSTDDAYDMVRRLARHAGILVGPSSGGAVHAALELARTLSEGVVVTVLPDGAFKYLSERFWEGDPGDD